MNIREQIIQQLLHVIDALEAANKDLKAQNDELVKKLAEVAPATPAA